VLDASTTTNPASLSVSAVAMRTSASSSTTMMHIGAHLGSRAARMSSPTVIDSRTGCAIERLDLTRQDSQCSA